MEEKKATKKKWLPLAIVLIIAVIIILGLGIFISKKGGGDKKVPTASTKEDLVTVEQRSLLMKSGETTTLTVKGKDIKYASNNPDVVTVDATGKVTAMKKGNAIITITVGEETEYCGVIVDGMGNMVDISKQKAKVIFSDVLLEEPGPITSLAVDIAENAYYLSQPYASTSYEILPSDIVVSKVSQPVIDGVDNFLSILRSKSNPCPFSNTTVS